MCIFCVHNCAHFCETLTFIGTFRNCDSLFRPPAEKKIRTLLLWHGSKADGRRCHSAALSASPPSGLRSRLPPPPEPASRLMGTGGCGGQNPRSLYSAPWTEPLQKGNHSRSTLQVKRGELEAPGSWKAADLESGLPRPCGRPEGTARETPGRTSGPVVSSHVGGLAFGLKRTPCNGLLLPWMQNNFASDLIKVSPVLVLLPFRSDSVFLLTGA